jgi:hypothetical protein
MIDPRKLRNDARDEGYRYFDKHIRNLPKNSDGSFNELSEGYHNNDVDAFRHAYVSGVFTQEFSERAANMFGRLNELFPTSSATSDSKEENMDLFNNAVGRKYGLKARSREQLLEMIHSALKNKELIIDLDDERKYEGAAAIKPSKDHPVIVVDQNKSGRNILFFDTVAKTTFSNDQFVAAIQNGNYPMYLVRNIHGQLTPVSKRDDLSENNLG